MNSLLQLFDINNTFFSLLGYQISYLEFIGTLFNLACVYLVARKRTLNWPIGIVGAVLFLSLFYQIHLYADLLEQIYFIATGFWGWYAWTHSGKPKDNEDIIVERNSRKTNIAWGVGILLLSIIGTWVMMHLNAWLPTIFPEPASLPFLDTLTTVMSFAATILMIRRKLENWILWIAVDVIAIWLYWYKGVPFLSLLYAIFLGLAISGYIVWLRAFNRKPEIASEAV